MLALVAILADGYADLTSYGIAAPFALICLGVARWAVNDRDKQVAAARAERDAERARTDKMTEQMIQLQGQVAPLLSEATAVIRVTAGRVG